MARRLPPVRPFSHWGDASPYGPPLELVTVGDPLEETWGYLRALATEGLFLDVAQRIHRVSPRASEEAFPKARSFVLQAYEYFQAARPASPRSAPLLYYYSLLNLAKFLIALAAPSRLRARQDLNHGLTARDARTIRAGSMRSRRGVFTSLTETLATEPLPETDLKLRDLIARCIDVSAEFSVGWNRSPSLITCVISQREDRRRNLAWTTIEIPRRFLVGGRARRLLGQGSPLLKRFRQVAGRDRVLTLQGPALKWRGQKQHTRRLALLNERLRRLRLLVEGPEDTLAPVLDVHRHYSLQLPLGAAPPLPEMSTILAVSFYLSHIVRYRPYQFESALSGTDSWIITTFTRSGPTKFVRLALNHAMGSEYRFRQI